MKEPFIVSFCIVFIALLGCGGGDDKFLPDSTEGQVELKYLGKPNIFEVDIVQQSDCDGNPATFDPEPFARHDAEVVFDVVIGQMGFHSGPPVRAGILATSYSVTFQGLAEESPVIHGFSKDLGVTMDRTGRYVFPLDFISRDEKNRLHDLWVEAGLEAKGEPIPYVATYGFSGAQSLVGPWDFQANVHFLVGDFDHCAP